VSSAGREARAEQKAERASAREARRSTAKRSTVQPGHIERTRALRSRGPSRNAKRGGDPRPSTGSGSRQVWHPPPSRPLAVGRGRRRGVSERRHWRATPRGRDLEQPRPQRDRSERSQQVARTQERTTDQARGHAGVFASPHRLQDCGVPAHRDIAPCDAPQGTWRGPVGGTPQRQEGRLVAVTRHGCRRGVLRGVSASRGCSAVQRTSVPSTQHGQKRGEPHDRLRGATDPHRPDGASRQGGEEPRRRNVIRRWQRLAEGGLGPREWTSGAYVGGEAVSE
jgi:hypothetical protein